MPSSANNSFSVGEEFITFDGTRRFITVFTTACYLSLFLAI